MAANIHPPAQRRKKEPRVGIFWLVDGKPLIDVAPLSEAEPYGDHLTHPRGHPEVWEQWQRTRGSFTRHGIRRVPTRARDVQHQDPALHVVGRQVHSPRKERGQKDYVGFALAEEHGNGYGQSLSLLRLLAGQN